MKTYRIVRNYDSWFNVDVPNDENTIIDEDELKRLANDWEKPVEELMEDLEEIMTISEETEMASDNSGKKYNAEELAYHTGEVVEYEGGKYILVRQASPDNVLGEGVGCYSAPAVKIGDEVDEDGYCKRYTVAWKVLEDYDPEGQGEDCACDWDDPYEVFYLQTGDYNILTGEFF